MPPSDPDAETEKLIAELIASDLAESYQTSSAPIGASWHDYEEPLSSYERQCLDAENRSDGEGESEGEGRGAWGWGEDSGGRVDGAPPPDQGLSSSSTEPLPDGTWNSTFIDDEGLVQDRVEAGPILPDGDSSFVNEEGLVQDYTGPMQTPSAWNSSFVNEEGLIQGYPGSTQNPPAWTSSFINEEGLVQEYSGPMQTPPAAWADDDDSDSDDDSADLPFRIYSEPTLSLIPNPAGEIRNLSAPMTLPSQRTPGVRLGEVAVLRESSVPCESPIPCESHEPDESSEPSDHGSQGEPLMPSTSPLSTDSAPTSNTEEVEHPWNDGFDYSSSKGKGIAVRAYDEYKQGMRGGGWEGWDRQVAEAEFDTELDADWNHDEGAEEEDDDDEDLQFIHIPLPHVDDVRTRCEEGDVVEIRVGDDETLESILRDISLREERREKGKGAEESIEAVVRGRTGRKDVTVAWW